MPDIEEVQEQEFEDDGFGNEGEEETEVEAPVVPVVDPAIEERAKVYGWVPKEDFRGDPTRWTPADQYVQRADEMLPIARSMNKKLADDVSKANAEIARLTDVVKRVAETHAKVAQTGHEARLKQINRDQEQALADVDVARFRELAEERDSLVAPEVVSVDTIKTENPDNAVVAQWKIDNDWYNTDVELGSYADTASDFIAKRHGNLTASQFMDKVYEEVKKKFPNHSAFGNANRRTAPPSDSSSVGGGDLSRGSGGKTYSDLPKEAKDVCDRDVKSGHTTKEKWAKEYFSQD